MQSWYCPPVPVLPGRGPQLRLYDSADRQVRPVAPGSKATMYVCGITPYDATHLGHAATYVTFDLIHRLWLDLGHELHYVQNITDIDDPLFERADRDGVDWRDLAQAEVALFCEDMAALRVLPPQDYVGATEAIAEMVELIEKMLACGAAYVIDREMGEYQDIYFRADATLQFGYESGYDRDTMLRLCEERGGDPRRPGKSDELDALAEALRPWDDVGIGTVGPARATFRLSEVETENEETPAGSLWRLEFLLQSTQDPSLLVPAEQAWNDDGSLRRWLDRPQELLLTELGRASRIFPELVPALRTACPSGLELDADGAYRFLSGTAAVLDEAGFGVLLPSWWDRRRKLGLVLSAYTPVDGVVGKASKFGREQLVEFRWELAVGDDPLSEEEIAALTETKSPLIRLRGRTGARSRSGEAGRRGVGAAYRHFVRRTADVGCRPGNGAAPGG